MANISLPNPSKANQLIGQWPVKVTSALLKYLVICMYSWLAYVNLLGSYLLLYPQTVAPSKWNILCVSYNSPTAQVIFVLNGEVRRDAPEERLKGMTKNLKEVLSNAFLARYGRLNPPDVPAMMKVVSGV